MITNRQYLQSPLVFQFSYIMYMQVCYLLINNFAFCPPMYTIVEDKIVSNPNPLL